MWFYTLSGWVQAGLWMILFLVVLPILVRIAIHVWRMLIDVLAIVWLTLRIRRGEIVGLWLINREQLDGRLSVPRVILSIRETLRWFGVATGDMHYEASLKLDAELEWRSRLVNVSVPCGESTFIEQKASVVIVGDWRKWESMSDGTNRRHVLKTDAYLDNGQHAGCWSVDFHPYGAPDFIMRWRLVFGGLRMMLSLINQAQRAEKVPQVFGYDIDAWPYPDGKLNANPQRKEVTSNRPAQIVAR